MKKQFISKLLVCALICAAISTAHAQNAAGAGGAPGGGGRGGGGRGGGGFGGGGFGGFGARGNAGPPAPVPPEVAMLRPGTDDLARMNATLKQFVQSTPDLKKFESIVQVTGPRDNSAIRPTQRNAQRHAGFVEIAKTNTFDILFAGDSITDFWQQAGSEVQKNHFGDMKIANFAISGDTTQGVLWGLQNGEGQGHKPKAVMLMIGTNNTGGNTGPEIAEGVGAVVYELRKDFPDAKIMLLAIFPRGTGPNDGNRLKNDEANKIIAKLHDGTHIFFTNINDKFLNPDGTLNNFPDNLHPNAAGYEIWAKAVAPTLKEWIK